MKKLFAPTILGAWLAGLLPDQFLWLGKKTPWYRQSWMANAPWLAAVLMAPLGLFLLYKGASLLRSRTTSQSE